MNLYATVSEFRDVVSTAKTDAQILWLLEGASRELESLAGGRVFWTEIGVRYFDGPERDEHVSSSLLRLAVDDCQAVSAVGEDTVGDWTWSQAWTVGTDYALEPYQGWPKRWLVWLPGSALGFCPGARRYKVTGTWGAGDCAGLSWETANCTGTVATALGTTLTISVSAGLKGGQTIKVGDEQMFVTAVSGTSATVERGVNGSSAAVHTAGAVSLAVYPMDVRRAAVWLASWAHNLSAAAGVMSEGIGQYRVTYRDVPDEQRRRLVGRVRRY